MHLSTSKHFNKNMISFGVELDYELKEIYILLWRYEVTIGL